jgi:hypothetical protein
MAGKENAKPGVFVANTDGVVTPPPDWCNKLAGECTELHDCTGHPNECGYKCHEIWATVYHKGGKCYGHKPITDVNKANASLQRYAAQLAHCQKIGLNPLNFAVKRKLRNPLEKIASPNRSSLAESHSEEVTQVAKIPPPHPKVKKEIIPVVMRSRSNSRQRRDKKRRDEFPAIATTSAAAATATPAPHWPIAEDRAEAKISTMIAIQMKEAFTELQKTLRDVIKSEMRSERDNIDAALEHTIELMNRDRDLSDAIAIQDAIIDTEADSLAMSEVKLTVDSSVENVLIHCFGPESPKKDEEEIDLMDSSPIDIQ